MARPILDDALWQIIEPLLPPPKRRRKRFPGRKSLDNRAVLTGILFVLKTGIAWEKLPQEMGYGSGMTCWRRLAEWRKAGVWDKIYRTLLDGLRNAGQFNSSRMMVRLNSVRAVFGESTPAPIQPIAAIPGRRNTWQRTDKGVRVRRRSKRPKRPT
jgi:transposase